MQSDPPVHQRPCQRYVHVKKFPGKDFTIASLSSKAAPPIPSGLSISALTHAVTAVFINLIGVDELFTTMKLFKDILQRCSEVRRARLPLLRLRTIGMIRPCFVEKPGHPAVKVIVEQYPPGLEDREGAVSTKFLSELPN
jgi:hypothetical protein